MSEIYGIVQRESSIYGTVIVDVPIEGVVYGFAINVDSSGSGTGTDGAQGIQGIQGITGSGTQGIQGRQGTQGTTGSGVQGIQGIQGIQGRQGTQGTVGAGTQGAQGTQGTTGSGVQGIQGIQGIQGGQGITGSGAQGTQGAIGSQGTQGITGTGAQGIQGITGTGIQGVQGVQGITGSGGSGDELALFIDTVNHRVGIGTQVPSYTLDISGNLNIITSTTNTGIIYQNNQRLLHTYGTSNLFLGVNAANFTTTGQQNTMIGYQAGAYLGASSYNTAVGHQALYSNVTNGENAAFGRMSLMYATGSYNSGLGNTSLGGVGFTGSCNVGIGKDAGRTLTSGNHSTYIGYCAGYHASQLNSAAYSMALGDQAYNTKSYQVVLGAENITETILRGVINVVDKSVPTTATSTGQYGDIVFDASYMYRCVSTNTWKRAALSTW